MRPLTADCWPPAEGEVEDAAPPVVELSSRLTLSIESAAETRLLEVNPTAAAAVVEAFLRNDCSSTTFNNHKYFCYVMYSVASCLVASAASGPTASDSSAG